MTGAVRVFAAAFLTAALILLIAIVRIGDIAADEGDTALALSLTWHTGEAGDMALVRDGGINPQQDAEIADAMLANSPLSGTALALLVGQASNSDQIAKAEKLIRAGERLGWRNIQMQRVLYNWEYSQQNYFVALKHANALLRQRKAANELFAHFDSELPDPAFRKALAATLDGSAYWQNEYLDHAIAEADPDLAADLVIQSRWSEEPDFDRLAGRLANRLLNRQAYDAMIRLAQAGGSDTRSIAPWTARKSDMLSPFNWDLPGGYTVRDDGSLAVTQAGNERSASVMTALPKGRYRLESGGSGTLREKGWFWAIACIGGGNANVLPANIDQFSIDADCRIQRFTLSPRSKIEKPLEIGELETIFTDW